MIRLSGFLGISVVLMAASLVAAPFDRVLDESKDPNVTVAEGNVSAFAEFDGKLYAVGFNRVTPNSGSANATRSTLIYASDDAGDTWEGDFITGDLTTLFYAVTTSDNRIVATGATERGVSDSVPGFAGTLTPGGIWNATKVPTGGTSGSFSAISVAYGAGKFIYGAAQHGRLYASTDGLNWERLQWELDDVVSATIVDVLWDGDRFVLMVDHQFFTSSDGNTWVEVQSDLTTLFTPFDLTYLNGIYFVSGTQLGEGFIASSTDLITWAEADSRIKQGVSDIAYGNGYYVASTQRFEGTSLLYYSTDGKDWTEFDSGLGNQSINTVAFLQDHWFIGANDSTLGTDMGIYKATDEFPPQVGTITPTPNPWANAFPAGNNVFFDLNLGFFFFNFSESLWTYNYLLGWMYPVGDYSPDLWMYLVNENNWMYANTGLVGFTFRVSDGKWYYYDVETNFFYPSS